MTRSPLLAVFVLFFASLASAAEWQEVKSEHFIVHYKQAPQRFVDNTLARAEETYNKTMFSLGFTRYKSWTWKNRVNIYIYDDAGDYRKSSGYAWAGGSVKTRVKVISAYPSAQGFFDSVLPHEIGHIVFRDFIGPEAVVPLWLEEGVAMYQEESGHWGSDDDVRKIMAEGRFIPLEALSQLKLDNTSDRQMVRVFYAESASLVSFLINQGEIYRFVRLCREVKDGNRFEWAFKKVYIDYRSLEGLEANWKGYLSNEKKERH